MNGNIGGRITLQITRLAGGGIMSESDDELGKKTNEQIAADKAESAVNISGHVQKQTVGSQFVPQNHPDHSHAALWVTAVGTALAGVAAILNPTIHPQDAHLKDETVQEEQVDRGKSPDNLVDPRFSSAPSMTISSSSRVFSINTDEAQIERYAFIDSMAASRQARDVFVNDLWKTEIIPGHDPVPRSNIGFSNHRVNGKQYLHAVSPSEHALLTLIDTHADEDNRTSAALYLGALGVKQYSVALNANVNAEGTVGIACKVALQMMHEQHKITVSDGSSSGKAFLVGGGGDAGFFGQ